MAIRVSSDKQGLDGDSPEAQREQCEAYAKAHNIIITETIILLESASRETQPTQKVINACKDKSKGFQIVACPKCGKILSGSASRGKMGACYPAYHCSRDGHYFRVPKAEFDKTIEDFVRAITIKPEYIDDIIAAIAELWREPPSKATRSQPTAPRVPPEPAKPDSGDRGQNARCHERNGAYVLGRGYY